MRQPAEGPPDTGPPYTGERVWPLPPLILHPFSGQAGPGKLLEGSKAALMLAGMLPRNGSDAEELSRKLLEGRYCEVRMIYYIGRDLRRWVGQCVEVIGHIPELAGRRICASSFCRLLVDDPPASVRLKLEGWGVSDYKLVFSRALGLSAVFRGVPLAENLSDDFLRNYHRFADHLFACTEGLEPFAVVHAANFQFDLYGSGEFSRLLEQQWGE
jgi:hypothetical protein